MNKNGVRVVYRAGGGSYWSDEDKVFYVDTNQTPEEIANTFVHEVNHAKHRNEPDPKKMGKQEYIDRAIDEEVNGVAEQIKSNQELRDARGPKYTDQTVMQSQYEDAYKKAVDAENAERARHGRPPLTPEGERRVGEDAGQKRIRQAFDNGEVVASTNRKMRTRSASCGSSAERPRNRLRRLPAVLAAVVLLGVAGCQGGTTEGKTPVKPTPRPDEAVRTSIAAGLGQAGDAEQAAVVTRGGSQLTPVPAPFLKTWKIFQVDYRQGAHPVRFFVASSGSKATLLTGRPKAFTSVTAEDGANVADPATAATLARLYVETTRPAEKLTYVVGSVDEIQFRPGLSGDDAARKDAIVKRYRPVVKAPEGAAQGDGFAVTVFVVKDSELQRRAFTVSKRGAVTEKTTTLVKDLPVPMAL
ncbi:hypothetical protein [Actinomadura kijaniata]|uniref:hypothetical protein n=1 Tax=Actinomadura kijaniata TaxID=46161 RepID=UPI0008373766|nr:hypothetical protein [Actinomadura kijaniata]